MTAAPQLVPRLQILATALLFSTGGAAIKACAFGPWQVASFRCGVAALAMAALVPAARRRWTGRDLLVAVAYAATMILYVFANKTTTAANAIFLQSTAPLYVLALAPLLLGERTRRRDLLLMAMMAAGLALCLLGGETPSATAPAPALGNLLGAAAGLTWALTIVGLRAIGRRGGDAAPAVVAGNALAFLATLPMALPVAAARPVDWLLVVYLGLFQVALAYVLMTAGLRKVPAFEASLLLLLEPVLNPVWAFWLHGETPSPPALAGGALVLAAVALKSWLGVRRRT